MPEAVSGFQFPVTDVGGGFTFAEDSRDGGITVYKCWAYHPAWDMNPAHGNGDLGMPVVAAANGRVVVADKSSGQIWGRLVIKHIYKGETFYTQYGHVQGQSISVSVGDDVVKGQQIAQVGKEGTDSAHLHFEIRNAAHPAPSDTTFWQSCTDSSSPSYLVFQNRSNITTWYQDPRAFVPAHGPYSSASVLLYVSVPAEKRIAVIDPNSDQVVDSISLSGAPQGIALSRDGSFLLAVLSDTEQLAKVRLSDKFTSLLSTPGAGAVSILPNGQKAYVTHGDENGTSITVVDTSTLSVLKSIPVGAAFTVLDNVNVAPSGLKAYASFGGFDSTIAVIDTTLDQLKTTIFLGTLYHDQVAFSADSSLAVASSRGANCPTNGGYSQIDGVNDLFLSANNLTSGKIGVQVSGDGSKAYLPDTCGSRNLLIFDLRTNTLLDSIPTGLTNEPSAIVLLENLGKAFVVDETGTISDVNLNTRTHLAFPISSTPFGGIFPSSITAGPTP